MLFLLYIRDKYNIKADNEAEGYIQNLSLQQFPEHIKDIHIVTFLRDICCDANQYIFNHLKPSANVYQLVAISFSSADILGFTTNNYNIKFFNYI